MKDLDFKAIGLFCFLKASLWDGKEKFRVVETEEQKQKRKEAYEKFIENE